MEDSGTNLKREVAVKVEDQEHGVPVLRCNRERERAHADVDEDSEHLDDAGVKVDRPCNPSIGESNNQRKEGDGLLERPVEQER